MTVALDRATLTRVGTSDREGQGDCGGYHFPHRRGGGACIHSERAGYYHALRQGVPLSEAMQLLTAGQLEAMFPVDDTLAG